MRAIAIPPGWSWRRIRLAGASLGEGVAGDQTDVAVGARVAGETRSLVCWEQHISPLTVGFRMVPRK